MMIREGHLGEVQGKIISSLMRTNIKMRRKQKKMNKMGLIKEMKNKEGLGLMPKRRKVGLTRRENIIKMLLENSQGRIRN